MDFKEFKAGTDDEGRRLDRILRKFLKEQALSSVYKTLRKGLIKVNGKKATAEYHVHSEDIISIPVFLLKDSNNIEKKQIADSVKNTFPFEILFENSHILVVNKPYDVTVHGKDDSMDVIVKKYILEKYKNSSLSFVPGPLHRLDRKTTGAICFSKSIEGARWFSKELAEHNIKKEYLTLLEGKLKETLILEDNILKEDQNGSPKKNTFHRVKILEKTNDSKNEGKTAITIVTPLKYGVFLPQKKEVTLCKIQIKTGRTHQIRAQCAFHGFPLFGDTAYNKNCKNKDDMFFLHAKSLFFQKNELDIPQEIYSPLPKSFFKMLEQCGISFEF